MVVIGGVKCKAHYLAMDLPQSDDSFVMAFPAETTEAFLEGHNHAFAYFKGVPRTILYDNTKIAVARILGDGTRMKTRAFSELQSHYLFAEKFGRPGKGNDKGKVEGLVGYARRNFMVPIPQLQRLMEARLGKKGKREYVQTLRLLETFTLLGRIARSRQCSAARRDFLRCGEASAAMPHRTAAGSAGSGKLSALARSPSGHHCGRGLSDAAQRRSLLSMDTPQVLLDHHLKTLRLPTFLREYDKVAQQCAAEGVDFPRYLLRLTELELLDRERRATERRIRQAKFDVIKSLDSFEFAAIPSLNKALVLELARCEFIERKENVLALGNSGTGKTHLALALGLAACQKGFRVRFTTAASLAHELIEAKDERRLMRFQKMLSSFELLIIDELGFVPLSKTGAELLFEVFSRRYERSATLVTSNLPFNEWTEAFGSERLTGHCLIG